MVMKKIIYEDLGLIEYKKSWDYQIKLFDALLANKIAEVNNEKHYLLFCEHAHVFTIGKNGDINNLLINNQLLAQKGIDYYHIDRGGDITYHGPGQQVVYPIFDLDEFGINTKEYVNKLEEAVIQTLEEFSIKSGRINGAAGIWLNDDLIGKCRKICAIGIKSSRRVTMHGIALNVNTDLSYFDYMNPCGFIDKRVTSMEKELGYIIDFYQVQVRLNNNILKQFNL
jgi:lipoyl(octanoyl) transferase